MLFDSEQTGFGRESRFFVMLPGAAPQVRHGESVLWRTDSECRAFGAKYIHDRDYNNYRRRAPLTSAGTNA